VSIILSTDEYIRFRAGKSKEIERLELQAKSFSEVARKQIELLDIRRHNSVLDAGCGTGSFARQIAPIVSPAKVTALDIDTIFIDEAKKLSSNKGLNNIDFQNGNIEDMKNFSNESFDVSYCRLVLPHLNDPEKGIAELKRVTKKNGVVASSDEGNVFTYPSIDKFFDLFGKAAQWRKSNQIQASAKKISAFELFKSAGLQNVKVYPIPYYASATENPDGLRDLSSTPMQMLEIYKDEVIAKGFMSEKEYEEGISDLHEWLARPDSFWLVLSIFTVAKM
jgi:ubiquinone/menaquinone biosynthesis C-methylase UbiE